MPRYNNLSGDESVLYNTSLEELNVSVPENANFPTSLNTRHSNQPGIQQALQQQPNNPYQGIQVFIYKKNSMIMLIIIITLIIITK